jgi:hypothetical protein
MSFHPDRINAKGFLIDSDSANVIYEINKIYRELSDDVARGYYLVV